jgi:flagellar motor switch protein FliN
MAEQTPAPNENPSAAAADLSDADAAALASALANSLPAPEAGAAGGSAGAGEAADTEHESATAVETAPADGGLDAADQAAIDELLRQASFDDPTTASADAEMPDADAFKLPGFQGAIADGTGSSSIDLLRDVELNVKIELGRSKMLVEDVLKLAEGSVVELDKLAGDPVDVFVNDRLVARGEVLVLNDNFCVRVNEIVAGLKQEGT